MELKAEKREIFGKKNKYLRNEKLLPGVIFGKGLESVPIVVDYIDFVKTFKEVGETTVFDILIGKEKHPVLVKEMQLHHLTSKPIHVGFYEVNLKEKITANIPIEVINEEENELIRKGEAIAFLLLTEIEVEALPTDLPEKFIVDALQLNEIGDVTTIADLEFDKEKVEIVDLEEDEVVSKLDYAQMLEEEEEEEEIDEAEAIAGIEATEEKEEDEEEGGDQEGSQQESAQEEQQ